MARTMPGCWPPDLGLKHQVRVRPATCGSSRLGPRAIVGRSPATATRGSECRAGEAGPSRPAAAAAAAAALVLAGSLTAVEASAAPGGPSARACADPTRTTSPTGSPSAVALGRVCRERPGRRCRSIANANGERPSGRIRRADDASAQPLVKAGLEAAGWSVSTQELPVPPVPDQLAVRSLEQATPRADGGPAAPDHDVLCPAVTVTAAVTAPSGDFRGCAAADWAGFPAGDIAD